MALNTLKSEIQFRLKYKIQKCAFHKKYTFKKVIRAEKKKKMGRGTRQLQQQQKK